MRICLLSVVVNLASVSATVEDIMNALYVGNVNIISKHHQFNQLALALVDFDHVQYVREERSKERVTETINSRLKFRM